MFVSQFNQCNRMSNYLIEVKLMVLIILGQVRCVVILKIELSSRNFYTRS